MYENNMFLAIYFILIYIASLIDFKKKEIPDLINICIVLLAIFYKEIHLFGLLIGLIFLLITIKYDCIGGGDIKFLLANGLIFGFWKTYFILLISTMLISIAGLFLFIKYKIEKKKFDKNGLPLMPYFFISSFFFLLN